MNYNLIGSGLMTFHTESFLRIIWWFKDNQGNESVHWINEVLLLWIDFYKKIGKATLSENIWFQMWTKFEQN